jgi:hypothetical protein
VPAAPARLCHGPCVRGAWRRTRGTSRAGPPRLAAKAAGREPVDLVLFDDGSGLRVGVVRRNHVVDGRAAGVDTADFDALTELELQRLAGLDESCPARNAVRRLSDVRVAARRSMPGRPAP